MTRTGAGCAWRADTFGDSRVKKFQVGEIADADGSPFDRQERISWWSQQAIGQARIMVVGAGAIGNETLKNLALLGCGNIFIVDMDTISTSNLSRTVLFRREDRGRKKAEVAAARTLELCLAADPRIDWFVGDVVWELGAGAFRRADLVLGCLDNAETRFAVNRQCWLARTPLIDAGIYELVSSVSVYLPGRPPCYQCGATKEQLEAARRRYSCDDFKRALVEESKVPTVQLASALASALQVQEAIKLLCGQEAAAGRRIFFQGKTNDFALLNYTADAECGAHASYPEIIPIPLDNGTTLRDFLRFISDAGRSGPGAALDLRGDRTFVISAPCRRCGGTVGLFKPSFRIFEHEVLCQGCRHEWAARAGGEVNAQAGGAWADSVRQEVFSLEETDGRILDMTLGGVGVPYLHVAAVADRHGAYKYYELSGDTDYLFPSGFDRAAQPRAGAD